MNYKELVDRVTGFGCPLFSVSWNPPVLQVTLARKVITYLEDRRVLYNAYELEAPEHCKQSVIGIRAFLTSTISEIETGTELGIALRSMRAACRKFLDTVQHIEGEGLLYRYQMGMGDGFTFDSALGELRGAIGIQLARLMVMFGLDCEGELLTILPPPIDLQNSNDD